MTLAHLDWTKFATELDGPRFARFHAGLTKFNAASLQPRVGDDSWRDVLAADSKVARAEIGYVEAVRRAIAPLTADIPDDVMQSLEPSNEVIDGRAIRCFLGSRRKLRSSR
jgi:hypothetical protein